MKKTQNLITSALPYANGPLHVGHVAGVHLPADIYYRFLKSMGEDCISLCGTDEHGVGIEIAAKKEGLSEKELVDKYRDLIFSTLEKINIRYDVIKGTHTSEHMELSQDFFNILIEKGFVEKREENQMYCSDCKQFLPDRYIEGTCPNCNAPSARGDQCEKCGKLLSPEELLNPSCKICNNNNLQEKETYNYYFLLSKISSELDQWIESHNFKKNVKTTAKKRINEGLSDRSISRDIKRGIPIPGDENKKMYVWFEAPMSYISFLGELFSEFRSKDSNSKIIHFLGKDNIPFHTIIWPAILLAHGGYKLPDDIAGNEFLNLEGQKISTSRDHAVWLHDIVEKFNPDYIRNYLIHCIPENKDSNFSWEEFKLINDSLANSLGNLVNRLYVFYNRFFDGKIGEGIGSEENGMYLDIEKYKNDVVDLMYQYKIKDSFVQIMNVTKELNKFFHDAQPRNIVKEDHKKAHNMLNIISKYLIDVAIMLQPFLPDTSKKILKLYNLNNREYTYHDIGKSIIIEGHLQKTDGYIFEKITDEQIKEEIFKLLSKKSNNK